MFNADLVTFSRLDFFAFVRKAYPTFEFEVLNKLDHKLDMIESIAKLSNNPVKCYYVYKSLQTVEAEFMNHKKYSFQMFV